MLYYAIFSFLPATDGKLVRALRRAGGKRASPMSDFSRAVSDAALRERRAARYKAGVDAYGMLKTAFSKFVFLSAERRIAVDKKLARAGYNAKAELFYADVLLRVIAVYMSVPIFLLLNIKLAAACTVILGIALYYKWIGEPDERLKRINEEIGDELPRFVSVLSYSMTTDRDLARTAERYIKIAKPALRADLEMLILEMKAGSVGDALKKFDDRIGNPQLSAFISGLIDAGRGIDQRTFFFLMEGNMKQLFIESKKKELSKRPAKVKKAIIAVGLCMFLIYLVPICIQLGEGMSMFR
jgi:hypothetical protein